MESGNHIHTEETTDSEEAAKAKSLNYYHN